MAHGSLNITMNYSSISPYTEKNGDVYTIGSRSNKGCRNLYDNRSFKTWKNIS